MQRKNRKGLICLVAGIFCLLASFIWMALAQSSVGPFLILASLGGALVSCAKTGWKKKLIAIMISVLLCGVIIFVCSHSTFR